MAVIQGMLESMALSRSQAIKTLSGIADPLTEHIAKCLVINNNQKIIHWQRECLNWLWRISRIRLKPNTKPLDAETIKQELKATAMWDTPESYIDYFKGAYPDEPLSDFYTNHPAELRVAILHIIDEFAESVESGTYNSRVGLLGLDSYKAKLKLK